MQGMIHDSEDKEEDRLIAWYSAETDRLKVTGAQEQQMAQIQANLARDIAATIPEPVEETQEQSQVGQQPTGPSPEDEAEMERKSMEQLMQNHAQLVDHHHEMAGRMDKLHQAITAPRMRVPVRDAEGNLTHVIDKPAEQPEELAATPQSQPQLSRAPQE